MRDWREAAMGADPNSQTDYSTNGHGATPFLRTLNGKVEGISEPSQVEDEPAEMLTIQVARKEAALIFDLRRAAFSKDPLAPTEPPDSLTNGNAAARPEWTPVPISLLPSEGEVVP